MLAGLVAQLAHVDLQHAHTPPLQPRQAVSPQGLVKAVVRRGMLPGYALVCFHARPFRGEVAGFGAMPVAAASGAMASGVMPFGVMARNVRCKASRGAGT
jgi:hypothetical protein